jgi:hypothetical protein
MHKGACHEQTKYGAKQSVTDYFTFPKKKAILELPEI